jgi:hypothetical protein
VLLSGVLSAAGGDGGPGGSYPGPSSTVFAGGGGGGGGQVTILSGSGGFDALSGSTVDVAGGSGGGGDAVAGAAGVIDISSLPEPSSLVLLATALPAAAYARRRRGMDRHRRVHADRSGLAR